MLHLDLTTAGLWLTVVLSGAWHGVNPAMGWSLAVSAALMGKGRRDLFTALALLAFGHLLAMAALLLPFALLIGLVRWQREIRIAAAVALIGFGLWLLIWPRRHRFLARIRPSQLALWSFAVALAHGAGLMLLPIYLGLCRTRPDAGHQAAAALMGGNLATAVLVSLVHAGAMICAGGVIAYATYRWLGLKFLSRSWFNLDRLWAWSLVAVGGLSLALAWLDGM